MQGLIASRYRILAELGRGGMGTVYRVADTLEGDREIALKVIRSDGGITPELRLRFKEEFRAMVKLKFPGTLEVYDYGEVDDQSQYLTMELVPGRELSDLVAQGPMPLETFFPLIVQLLRALGFVHSRHYVHRDIKAENIRIRDDGVLKLMDFGLMEQLGLPSSGKITGTPSYLAPEVATGGIIDASSDLYSVGCLAFEMLTGRLPFTGSLMDVIRAHIKEVPPSIREFRPELSERLEAIVDRLLAKNQTERYQRAAEAIEDLCDLGGLETAFEDLAQRTSYLTSSVLVGRQAELAELEAVLSGARQGEANAAFVGAPTGVGKSRLVQEILLQAKLDGCSILKGEGLEGGMMPYQAMSQALRPLIALSTDEDLAEHQQALSRILPELTGAQPAPPLPPPQEKARLHGAVVAWLERLSSRTPLVVFLDDLHWCDLPSLELLNVAIRQLKGRPVCFLATFRSDEASPSSPLWFTIEEGITRYLKLAPLSQEAMNELIRAMMREIDIREGFSQHLYDATAGNAFFLTETLRYLIEEGFLAHREGVWHFPEDAGATPLPSSVEAAVIRRLAQLAPEVRQLARVAAVVGPYQDLDMLLGVSQLAEDDLFAYLDDLVERQFLLRTATRYSFTQDRVREALYQDIPERERAELHLKCGQYLERICGSDLEARSGDLAHHYGRSPDVAKAFEFLMKAGDQARASGQIALAVDRYVKADEFLDQLDLPGKPARQIALWYTIGLFSFASMPQAAISALERCIPALERLELDDPANRDKLLDSVGYLGLAYGFSGWPDRGLSTTDRVRDILDDKYQAPWFVTRAGCLLAAGRFDEMHDFAERAGRILTTREFPGFPTAAFSKVGFANYQLACSFQGIKPSAELLDFALAAADAIGSPNLKNVSWSRYCLWLAWTGRQREALDGLDRITQNCRRIGAPPYPWALYLRPYLLFQGGDLDEAVALVGQALRYPHLAQDALAENSVKLLKAQLLLASGDARAAETVAEEVGTVARERGQGLIVAQGLLCRAQIALSDGQARQARSLAQRVLETVASGPLRNPLHEAIALQTLATCDRLEGQPDPARERLDRALAIVSEPQQDNPFEQGAILKAIGEIERDRGDSRAARAALVQAAERFRALGNRHRLRPILAALESLLPSRSGPARPFADRSGAEPALEPHSTRVEAPGGITQVGRQLSLTLDRLRSSGISGSDLVGELVRDASRLLKADPVFLLVGDARPGDRALEPIAVHPAGSDPVGLNWTLVSQALASQEGVVAIDMPEDLTASSNLEALVSSVAVMPLALAGGSQGALYCVRKDLDRAFGDEDLPALRACAETLARLIRTPEAAV